MFNELARAAEPQRQWGHTEELLLALCHRVDALVRVTVLANRDPKKRPPDFGPAFDYPRPGRDLTKAESAKTDVVRPREMARMLMGGG